MPSDSCIPRLWFVVRGDVRSGPFPVGALQQERAIGRLTTWTSVSPDGGPWVGADRLHDSPFQPSGSLPIDEWSRERAMAQARWADQRSGIDRRKVATHAAQNRRTRSERRAYPLTRRQPAARREDQITAGTERSTAIVALLFLAAVLLGVATYGTSNPIPVDIDMRPLSR